MKVEDSRSRANLLVFNVISKSLKMSLKSRVILQGNHIAPESTKRRAGEARRGAAWRASIERSRAAATVDVVDRSTGGWRRGGGGSGRP